MGKSAAGASPGKAGSTASSAGLMALPANISRPIVCLMLTKTSTWPVRFPGIEISCPDQKIKASDSHFSSKIKASTCGRTGALWGSSSKVPLKVKTSCLPHGTV